MLQEILPTVLEESTENNIHQIEPEDVNMMELVELGNTQI